MQEIMDRLKDQLKSKGYKLTLKEELFWTQLLIIRGNI